MLISLILRESFLAFLWDGGLGVGRWGKWGWGEGMGKEMGEGGVGGGERGWGREKRWDGRDGGRGEGMGGDRGGDEGWYGGCGGIEANYLWRIGYRRGLLRRRGGG